MVLEKQRFISEIDMAIDAYTQTLASALGLDGEYILKGSSGNIELVKKEEG